MFPTSEVSLDVPKFTSVFVGARASPKCFSMLQCVCRTYTAGVCLLYGLNEEITGEMPSAMPPTQKNQTDHSHSRNAVAGLESERPHGSQVGFSSFSLKHIHSPILPPTVRGHLFLPSLLWTKMSLMFIYTNM